MKVDDVATYIIIQPEAQKYEVDPVLFKIYTISIVLLLHLNQVLDMMVLQMKSFYCN